jgi:proteasome lid subunit RPN8/RPN11
MLRPDLSIFDSKSNEFERCGVIFKRTDKSLYIVELPNHSATPKNHFIISKKDVSKLKVLDKLVGIVHTHPFRAMRIASQHDIDSIPEGLVGMVYHPSTGSTVWYDRTGVIHEELRKRH